MIRRDSGRVLKFIFEFIIIFAILFISLILIIFIGAHIIGLDFKVEGDTAQEIEIKVYKKVAKEDDNQNVEKPVETYIQNDLSFEDDNLNYSVHTENDYFYNQLDDYGKTIYDKIVANSENLKSGDFVVEFNSEFTSMLNNGGEELLKTAYKNAVDCIRYDRLDMFYIDFTKMYLKIEKTTRGNVVSYNVYVEKGDDYLNYYINSINSPEQLNTVLEQIESKKNAILATLSGNNYQKILQVHDYLVDNLVYDETYELPDNDNLIGAFLNGNVVCEGYAKAFKYLLDDLQIPCILVIGDAVNSVGTQEKHMWNYVQINDEWYAVDVTWDDPILVNGGQLSDESRYKYFCRKSGFNENHFSDGVISVNGTEFIYPTLVQE